MNETNKLSCSAELWSAADVVASVGQFKASAILSWLSVRYAVFGWLESRKISYANTSDALSQFIASHGLQEHSESALIAYTFGMLAEWDESIVFDLPQLDRYRTICAQVISDVRRPQ